MLKTVYQKILPSVTKLMKRNCYVYCCPGSVAIPACYWSVLPNGVRVISEQTSSPIACISLFIEAGPRFETSCNNGITHYIEHMAYKGFLSMLTVELEDSLKIIGAKMTAHTSREYQVFSGTCFTSSTPTIINYLSRIMHELDICGPEMVRESFNVQQELYETDKDERVMLFDYLHQTAFQGTPLSKSVVGPSVNYSMFDRNYAKSFLCEHYQPYRLVLAASGCFSHNDIVCEAQKTFSCILQTSNDKDYGPNRFTGSQITYRNDSLPFAHVAVSVEAPGYGTVDYWKFKVMQYIIGKWHRSQDGGISAWPSLARSAATAQLCEYYETFYIAYRDVGLWGVYFVTANGTELDDMVYNVQDEWIYMCTTVQFPDVKRAIDTIKLDLAKSVDGSINSCHDMGLQMLYSNCRINLLDMYEILDSIQTVHIKECGMKYLYDHCPAVAAMGPTETLPDYNRLRSGMYWLRY